MGKPKDITGQRFGRLVVIEKSGKTKNGANLWMCKCDCGNEKVATTGNLNIGNTRSCGCLNKKDITGKRFGRLVALKDTGKKRHSASLWLCECDCGKEHIVSIGDLTSGKVEGCGCKIHADITGQRFGRLIAVNNTGKRDSNGASLWKCDCDCGNEKIANVSNLKAGTIKSCGCFQVESARENAKKASEHNVEKEYKEETYLSLIASEKIPKNNTSGVKGVSWDGGSQSWHCYLSFKGERVMSSYFKNKQDAINARKEAEEKYFKPILEKYGKTQ